MNFDALVQALGTGDEPLATLGIALAEWEQHAQPARMLLHRFAHGHDLAEATPAALYFLIPALAQMAETESFADLCTLAEDSDRLHSALGDDGIFLIYPSALVSTFGGDPAPLLALIDLASANDAARGDAILVLAYLTASGKVPERVAYETLAGLPTRLRVVDETLISHCHALAVAWLGFAGLSSAVEAAFGRGAITPEQMTPAEYWDDLRQTQQEGRDPGSQRWARLHPINDAVEHMSLVEQTMSRLAGHSFEGSMLDGPPEPIRNPLRDVGRNDPCPCGSGKKYKKCCLGN